MFLNCKFLQTFCGELLFPLHRAQGYRFSFSNLQTTFKQPSRHQRKTCIHWFEMQNPNLVFQLFFVNKVLFRLILFGYIPSNVNFCHFSSISVCVYYFDLCVLEKRHILWMHKTKIKKLWIHTLKYIFEKTWCLIIVILCNIKSKVR